MADRKPIGAKDGGYEKVAEGEVFDIWKTPSGKYSIFDSITGVNVGRNIASLENAITIMEEKEGITEIQETETAISLKKEGHPEFSEMLARRKPLAMHVLGETFPVNRPAEYTYVGGDPRFETWRSSKGRYTVTKRLPGREVNIFSGLTEDELKKIIESERGKDIVYQTELSEMPTFDPRRFGRVDTESLHRQLQREKLMEQLD